MIDLHSHVLPGIDDGPADIAGSLALARAAVEAGTEVLAATPHIDHGYGIDPRGVAARVERLRSELEREGIGLDLVTGGEVAFTRAPDLDTEDLAAVAFGGRWILLECPFSPDGNALEAAVYSVRTKGFDVLLAHPERSPSFGRDLDRLARLVADGAATSVTASSLTGRFGPVALEQGLRMLEGGLVHDLASDAHSADRRKPGLAAGLEAAALKLEGVEPLGAWLTRDVPAALLAGRPLPPAPAAPPRRRGGAVKRLFRRS